MKAPALSGQLDTSSLPLRARLALALAVLFRYPVELPFQLPPLPRGTRRALVRSAANGVKRSA